jgi:phosphonopyruvate decarboxylase
MIEVDSFTQCFLDQGLNYFTGVPDSTLKEWLRFLPNKEPMLINRIAANEGSAISNAAGYHLATGNIGVVYLQNSGLGNCINPLTSLMDSDVYGIPVVMLIGWRGEPGTKDEPQHKKMGNITEEMLAVLDIPYEILDNDYEKKINNAIKLSKSRQGPSALIVKPGSFAKNNEDNVNECLSGMIREDAIKYIVSTVKKSEIILSTTGKNTRELYEVCSNSPRGHNNNFYNVGSMGYVSSIGLEVAIQKKDKLVYVLDGDGALVMHMGSLAAIGNYQPKNLVHIVFDNEVHESTGNQSTLSKAINIASIMKGCNYKRVETVFEKEALLKILNGDITGPLGIVIKVKIGSRNNLGRPTDTPKDTKIRFMNWNN